MPIKLGIKKIIKKKEFDSMDKKFLVTYSVCGTMVIEAKNKEEAREKALAMSSDEILEEVKVALEGDSYEVGTIEEFEK